jgi:hypothetical protein
MDLTKKIIARLELKQVARNLMQVTCDMPVWMKKDENGKIIITLGLLGGIMTWADKDTDIDNAIREAIQIFFERSQLNGNGLNEELKSLGWQVKRNSVRFRVGSKQQFNIPNEPVLAGIMQTANEKSISLQLATY